jgi:hypothetical protein
MPKLPAPQHSCAVVRFPPRRISRILIMPERDGPGWLALIGSYGWIFGSLDEARDEAEWLRENYGLPVRECVS